MSTETLAHGDGQLLVFKSDEQLYALKAAAVLKVLRAVAITPVHGAPASVDGLINVQGRLLPVLNFRRCIGGAGRALRVTNKLIVLSAGPHEAALLVDEVVDTPFYAATDWAPAPNVLPALSTVQGVLRRPDGLVLIEDVALLLAGLTPMTAPPTVTEPDHALS